MKAFTTFFTLPKIIWLGVILIVAGSAMLVEHSMCMSALRHRLAQMESSQGSNSVEQISDFALKLKQWSAIVESRMGVRVLFLGLCIFLSSMSIWWLRRKNRRPY